MSGGFAMALAGAAIGLGDQMVKAYDEAKKLEEQKRREKRQDRLSCSN